MPNTDPQGIAGRDSEVDIAVGPISRAIAKHMHDPMPNPHALENLPPLDAFTDAALLADFAAEIEMGTDARMLEWSPAAQTYADEILRRMAR